ncbi:MAG TPA: DUF493 domain-containing protein [Pseudomonadales bacterium]|nr:DUF493 domain-containing protein [Pseudomonadales bacterium]
MTDSSEFEKLYPSVFPLKVIGRNESSFYELVVELVSHHVPGLPPEAFSTTRSKKGNYMSVSVTFVAQSRSQVSDLYRELTSHPRILMAL